MMTNKGMKAFFLLGAMLFCIVFAGCSNNLNICKEEGIAKIDARLNEIRAMELEYDLSVIEYEAEKAKELIRNTEEGSKIQTITDDALNTINSLILSQSEMNSIKEACSIYQNGGPISEDIVSSRKIMHYFGKIGGYYVAIVESDFPMLMPPSQKYYMVAGYTFEYLPEVVSLYKDGLYFSLANVYFEGNLSNNEFALIHERFIALKTK